MRVHELAKELMTTSKDILEKLHDDLKVEAKNHMAKLEDEHVAKIREIYAAIMSGAANQQAGTVTETPAAPKPDAPEEPSAPTQDAPDSTEKQEEEPTGATDGEEAEEAAAESPTDKTLTVKPPVVVRDLAEMMDVKPNMLIAELMKMNIFASINQKIEMKIVQALAERYGFTAQHEKKKPKVAPPQPKKPEPEQEATAPDKAGDLESRPPVVAFMGHVDHGKTSLLDRIRHTKVTAGESGGITQHIGAYTIKGSNGYITFLDTPGHEAFTKMRARGANLTDIAVIVVDACDGLMPQTREAIQHAKAAGVAIMVAINKIDLRAANPDNVKTQLQSEGLQPDDWGGETICCLVSAETGEGIDNLLEMINLQAEMLELKANPHRSGQGYVIEAQLETGMGPTASLLIRKGTLNVGDAIIVGPHWGKIKALIDDQGKKTKKAGPSYAVKCLGLSGVPEAGAEFVVMENEKAAKLLSGERTQENREQSFTNTTPTLASFEELLKAAADGEEKKELKLIVKADVQGSIEAIQHVIQNINSDKITVNMLLSGVGNISSNDVLLATASKALIVGFHVSIDNGVRGLAKREGVEIKLYNIIYELMDELKAVMAGMLDPIMRESVHGQAVIKQVFDLGKKGKIAGCLVRTGKVTAKSRARVIRDGDSIFEGAVANLKRFQNDANEVREGQECGIRLDHFTSYATGDIIELYDVEKIIQQL